MGKKYELTDETMEINGVILHRIKSLKVFGDVKTGDLGGWIEKRKNLSQEDNCWVYGDAQVFGNARVFNNARAFDNAQVFGNARVFNNARVFDNAQVFGNAEVYKNASVTGNVKVSGNAWVHGNAWISENAQISGDAKLYDKAWVHGNAQISGNVRVSGNARIHQDAVIASNSDYAVVQGFGTEGRSTTFFKTKDGVSVNCGCFSDTLEQFREQVKKTRKGKIAEEYLTIADFMEKHFKE